MIDKKSFDKKTIQICSYDISRKERSTSNTELHLLHPIVYQSNKFILLKSEALRFYIYKNIDDELVVHVEYQQLDVAFNLFKRFKRLILHKCYVKYEYEEEDCTIEHSGIRPYIRREEHEYRKYSETLDFSDVDRVEESKDPKHRCIKFIFSDKGKEKGREKKNRFSSLMFDENLDMRIISSIIREEEGFDIYKSKVHIDIYLEVL